MQENALKALGIVMIEQLILFNMVTFHPIVGLKVSA